MPPVSSPTLDETVRHQSVHSHLMRHSQTPVSSLSLDDSQTPVSSVSPDETQSNIRQLTLT